MGRTAMDPAVRMTKNPGGRNDAPGESGLTKSNPLRRLAVTGLGSGDGAPRPVPSPVASRPEELADMDVERYAEAELPTAHGPFRLIVYRPAGAGPSVPGAPVAEHMAIVRGKVEGQSGVLARVHSECWTSEVIGSLKCDCREQLDVALERIAAEGAGLVVYLRQEGRGI